MNLTRTDFTGNPCERWRSLGGIWAAALCLASLVPSYADISAVVPAEGTVGTEIILTGSGFGEKRGKVELGEERCRVLSWGDTQITCQVMTPQPAGDYTITVSPQGSKKATEPMAYSSFAMQRPQITPDTPLRLVAPGELVTIEGAFFGDKKGEVYLVDHRGDRERAKIRDWSMNSIAFEIPDGLIGTCRLGVINEVGLDIMPLWGTFTPVPPGAGGVGSFQWEDVGTIGNASGIYFNDMMWIFTLSPTANNPYIGVFRIQNGRQIDYFPWIWGDGETLATMAPIVIDHELWLFVTGVNNDLCYTRYNPVSNKWESSYHHIPGATTKNTAEIAPVHNLVTGRIEVYYNYTNSIHWVYSDDYGTTWHPGGHVAGIGAGPTAPSAIFYQKSTNDYSTLLAVGISNTATVYTVKNGVASSPVSTPFGKVSARPFLCHLGEDYLGLIWREADMTKPWLCKMDKKTGQWLPKCQPLNVEDDWAPNAVVDFEQKSDTNAPPHSLGSRWDAHFYIIYGKRVWSQVNPIWQVTPVEYVGHWSEVDPPTDLDLAADAEYLKTFHLWPIIGLVDAPPFVLNGESLPDQCTELTCTSVQFGYEAESATTIGCELKAGPYFETGEKSPLKLELTASVSKKFESTKSASVESVDTMFCSEDGRVTAYYVAPQTRTHKLEWIDMTGHRTSNYVYQLEMTGAILVDQTFDPTDFPYGDLANMPATYFDPEVFPFHGTTNDLTRLGTYHLQTGNAWFTNTVAWSTGQDSELHWTTAASSTQSTGFEAKLKIGGTVKESFGIGMEGSFEVHVASSTTVKTKSRLYLVDAPEPDLGEINGFWVHAYWLKPDPLGYWVPLNRQSYGDQPWFITYGVDHIGHQH